MTAAADQHHGLTHRQRALGRRLGLGRPLVRERPRKPDGSSNGYETTMIFAAADAAAIRSAWDAAVAARLDLRRAYARAYRSTREERRAKRESEVLRPSAASVASYADQLRSDGILSPREIEIRIADFAAHAPRSAGAPLSVLDRRRRVDADERDHATMARDLGFTRARISQLMDLLLLAPDLQEEILFLEVPSGKQPISERALREAVLRSLDWVEQRRRWRALGVVVGSGSPSTAPSSRERDTTSTAQL